MKDEQIRYDKSIVKRLLIFAIVVMVYVLAVYLPSMFTSIRILDSNLYTILYIIATFSIFLDVILWVMCLDGIYYLKTLEKAGFEVPINRRDYDMKFQNLAQIHPVDQKLEGRDKSALSLSYVAGFGVFIVLLFAADYTFKWRKVTDVYFLTVCIIILAGLWGIATFVYYQRSDNTKYRDFYIVDDRKLRKTFAHGIITMIITGAVSAACISMPYSMTRYICKSNVGEDRARLLDLAGCIDGFFEINEVYYEDEWPDSYNKLVEGVNIFEENWDNDMFTRSIYQAQGIEDFGEIYSKLRTKHAEVYLRYEDGYTVATFTYDWEYGKRKTETLSLKKEQ